MRTIRPAIPAPAVIALAMLAVVLTGAARSGARTEVPAAASPGAAASHAPSPEARGKHALVRDRLSFPVGAAQTVRRVETQAGQIDEVDELDAKQQPVAVTQFDAAGNLRLAVRLDAEPRAVNAPSRAAGIAAATSAAVAVGLANGRPSRVVDDPSTGGWVATWDRVENGVPVRGDGTTIVVWPDGRVASLSCGRHDLAPAPASRITGVRAVALAQARLKSAAVARYTVGTPTLQWISPNGAFDSSRPIGGDALYRLAWVVNARAVGETSGPWMVTMYIDARDGTLLGGDLVE